MRILFGFLGLSFAMLVTGVSSSLAAEGKALVEKQCVSCHDIKGPAPSSLKDVKDRKAPDLFYAGSKFQREWLVDWLQHPTLIRPSGTMFLNTVATEDGQDVVPEGAAKLCPTKLDAAQAGQVADFLMTLKDASMKTGMVDLGKEVREPVAAKAFRKDYPCIGCHKVTMGRKERGGISGPDLREAGKRLNPDWVYSRIENPQHWDPKTWMPRLEMSHDDREMLTLYLMTMGK